MEFSELVGDEFLFYGVDNQFFKIDDTIWEVQEDPNDGYRSMLGTIEVCNNKAKNKLFFREPIAIVRVEEDPEIEGFRLRDTDHEHTWLQFGTDESESYYPCFRFNYTPMKVPQKKLQSLKNKAKAKIHDHDIHPFDRLFDPRTS